MSGNAGSPWRRIGGALCGAALAVALAAAPGVAEPLRRLVVMPPEIVGDLEAPAARDAWPGRLERLHNEVAEGLAAGAVYALADAEAAAEAAGPGRRADVIRCVPCATAAAEAAGAERVLALQVHRMSALVLSLHAVVRDGASGEAIHGRVVGFRGDNDEAWHRAARHLVRELAGIPADRR